MVKLSLSETLWWTPQGIQLSLGHVKPCPALVSFIRIYPLRLDPVERDCTLRLASECITSSHIWSDFTSLVPFDVICMRLWLKWNKKKKNHICSLAYSSSSALRHASMLYCNNWISISVIFSYEFLSDHLRHIFNAEIMSRTRESPRHSSWEM